MLMNPICSSVLDCIPEPQTVRERLGQVVREANVLRALLRLSERKVKAFEQRQKEGVVRDS